MLGARTHSPSNPGVCHRTVPASDLSRSELICGASNWDGSKYFSSSLLSSTTHTFFLFSVGITLCTMRLRSVGLANNK